MSRGVFITGTDTDVGKTYVAAALLRALARRGERVVGMKPVASGGIERNGETIWDDVERLRCAGSVAATAVDICPYRLRAAIAPHLAAAREGVTIRIEDIVRGYESLAAKAQRVIVEGAGGWRVPLNGDAVMGDLARLFGLDVVLVVDLRLGCLNHALLSAEAILRDGATLRGWVANVRDPAMPALAGNIDTLERRLSVKRLATFERGVDPDAAADQLADALIG